MTNQSPETLRRQAHVPVELAGERVDKVAAQLFSEFSRAELTRWMTEGALTLDGAAVKPKYKVFGVKSWCCRASATIREDWQSAEAIALDVLMKTRKSLLLTNQPAWWCTPGRAMPMAPWSMDCCITGPDLNQLPRAGVVHRLDKETSGIMVVAATP